VVEGLLSDLAELGATDPQEFLDKFPLEKVQAWVDWALRQPQGKLKNPAGLIYVRLEKNKDAPPEPNPERKFKRGKYGHIYNLPLEVGDPGGQE